MWVEQGQRVLMLFRYVSFQLIKEITFSHYFCTKLALLAERKMALFYGYLCSNHKFGATVNTVYILKMDLYSWGMPHDNNHKKKI